MSTSTSVSGYYLVVSGAYGGNDLVPGFNLIRDLG